MASKKKRNKKKRPVPNSGKTRSGSAIHPPAGNLPEEDRRSLATTVGWMLTVLATCAGLILFVVASLIVPQLGEEIPDVLRALPDLMLFTVTVTGLLSLFLTAVALRVRDQPTPRSVTIFAVVVGCIPLLVQIFRG